MLMCSLKNNQSFEMAFIAVARFLGSLLRMFISPSESSLCSLCSECLDHDSMFISCCSSLPADIYVKKILHSKWVQGTFYKSRNGGGKVQELKLFKCESLSKMETNRKKNLSNFVLLGRSPRLCGGSWRTRTHLWSWWVCATCTTSIIFFYLLLLHTWDKSQVKCCSTLYSG